MSISMLGLYLKKMISFSIFPKLMFPYSLLSMNFISLDFLMCCSLSLRCSFHCRFQILLTCDLFLMAIHGTNHLHVEIIGRLNKNTFLDRLGTKLPFLNRGIHSKI